MGNSFDSTPILTGEDAERFEEAIANPKPVSKEEFAEMEKSYATARRMGMYTVDDLKCCGNCVNFKIIPNYGSVCKNPISSGRSPEYNVACVGWEFDRILKEERL